jgi:HYR domain/Secretion system C-terminal sorting domain
VTVVDTLNPTITCPADFTVAAGAMCTASPLFMGMNEATSLDNCTSTVTYSPLSGSTLALGMTTITAKATDPAGLMATCLFTVTVADQTAPTFHINTPLNLYATGVLNCDALANFVMTADSVKDNCSMFASITLTMAINYPFSSGAPMYSGPYNAAFLRYFDLGTTSITFYAEDAAGNTSSSNMNVYVYDNTAPTFNTDLKPPSNFPPDTIICNRNIVLVNAANNCSNTYTWRRPHNAYNDVEDCLYFTVTESVSRPSVATAISTSVYNLTNGYYALIPPATASVTAQFPVGLTTISYEAEDDEGNTSICSFTVTVTDNQPPMVICPPNTTLNTTCPTATLPDYRNGVNVFDNCGASITITQTPAPGTALSALPLAPPNMGDMQPIMMAISDGTNVTNCSFVITLDDGDAPLPTIVPLPNKIDSCGSFTMLAPVARDACNPTTDTIFGTPAIVPTTGVTFIPGSPRPSYRFAPGVYNVTWSYNDGNGNISSQNHQITVLADTFPPVAICRPLIVVPLQADGDTTITVGMIDNGSYDPNNCGVMTRALSRTLFTCAQLDTNLVVLTVTDINGRTATCTSRVVIRDITAPVITGAPANITITTCDTIPAPPVVIGTDACTVPIVLQYTQTSNRTATGCGHYSYIITRKWVARDARMNADSVTRTITIVDQAPSFAMVPDSVVVLTGPNRTTCTDTVRLAYQTLVKDCIPGLSFALTGGTFPGVYGVGTHFVTISATDSCGNNASKIVRVVVRDGTPPQAVCINGISTTVGPGGQAVITQAQINNNSFDNCGTVTVDTATFIFTCADADGTTQHPVSIKVRDAAGNTSMCITYVIVQDNVAPTVTCPSNITVQCTNSLLPATTGTASASDNCPGTLTAPAYTDTQVAGPPGTCAVITRRWVSSDLAGNTGVCFQVITQRDTMAPTFSALPVSDTVECRTAVLPAPTITATDNCDLSVAMVFVQDTINRAALPCGKYNFTVRRTWTGTDDCGLVTTRSYFIMVRDTVRPSFPGMPDTITVNSASYPTQPNCTIPYSFDAFPFLSECADTADLTIGNTAPIGANKLKFAGNYAPGTYKVRFNVTDPCGNLGRDSITFIFRDNTTPTMICQTSIDVALGSSGSATIDTADINIGTYDNCGLDTMYLSRYTFNCSNLGMNAVTLTAIDNNGNVNNCVANVNVLAGTAASFTANVSGSPTTYYGASTGSANATITSGTGSFTYLWSTGGSTPTITNLAAGTYTVTITGATSGCVRIDTAIVVEGPKIKLTVGNVTATVGQTVLVPVTVTNMNGVASFSFAINGINPTIAVVTNIVNINPAIAPDLIYTIAGNTVSAAWVSTGPVTLPANTVLFNIEAIAIGAVNSITPATIGASGALPFEFIAQFGATQVVVPVDVMNGSINISSSAQNSVGGYISTWINPDNPSSVARPVKEVAVSIGVVGVTNDTTAADGLYSFSVPTASNSLTTPVKITAGNAGVTSADLLRIINHIFGTTMMSPYQQIAANVNNDTIISLGDYLKIQRLVLGTVTHLDAAPDWIFIPRSFTFPVGVNPLRVAYPTTIAHNPLLINFPADDFVAIRRGDTNGNTPVTIAPDQADDRFGSTEGLYLTADNAILAEGTEILIPMYSEQADVRQALQGTIQFDTRALTFTGVHSGSIDMKANDLGVNMLTDGYVTFAYANRNSVSIDPSNPVFTLKFVSKQTGKQLSDVIAINSVVTKAESYTLDGLTTPLVLNFRGDVQLQSDFMLLQNTPNPSSDRTVIGFTLQAESEATLRITNVEGKVVRTVTNRFAKGNNQLVVTKAELGGAGVYFYELTNGAQTERSKMIFVD